MNNEPTIMISKGFYILNPKSQNLNVRTHYPTDPQSPASNPLFLGNSPSQNVNTY